MIVSLGLSKKEDPYSAGKEAAEIAKKQIPKERIDLAIVFSSVNLATPGLLKGIKNIVGEAKLTGCSGYAIISNFGIEKEGACIMLVSSKNLIFSTEVVSDVSSKGFRQAGEELGTKLLKETRGGSPRDLGIILSDGLLERAFEVISGIQERLGRSFPLVGGCSSDALQFLRTFQYFEGDVLCDSIIGVLISRKVVSGVLLTKKFEYGIGIGHGFKPLGKLHTVTEAKANVVKKIDSKPAISIYQEYLGEDIKTLQDDFKYITRLYPLGVYLEGEREYLLRSVLNSDKEGSLTFGADIPADSKIRLMIGTKKSLLEAANSAAEEAKSMMRKKADLVFIFDSFSRKMILGREAEKEIEIIKRVFGDTPFAGFYTYGEKAPLKALGFRGQSYLHNHSITILAIGE